MSKNIVSMGVILSLLFLFSTARATVWYVHPDSSLNSIQAGLDSCTTGDTVLVAPATYYEYIVWPSTQGITLQSEHGPDTTIIDALATGRVFTIETQIDSTTVIEGFTITNGNAGFGGGILCSEASPTIRNNVINSNYADYSGGGIYCVFCSPLIINNEISDNEDDGSGGGGIACYEAGAKIIENIISNNIGGFEGGGIQVFYYSQSLVTGNTITGNYAPIGGGVHIEKSYATITYNTIFNNSSENPYRGDGVNFCGSDGEVNYNNIFDNGHGMYAYFQDWSVNAEYNWWGDSTGPYHPITNPGGLGDSVSDYIDFTPWLSEPVGIEEHKSAQPFVALLQVRPNPFRYSTQIRYEILDAVDSSQKSVVRIKIYDATGRLVKDLRPTPYSLRTTQISWDGTDQANRGLPSGVYFLKFSAGEHIETRKLLLIR